MLAFSNFYGRKHKNASYFLNDLEAFGQDENEVNLIVFPLVLKDEAKIRFQGLPVALPVAKKGDWDTLKETFLANYVTNKSPRNYGKKWPTCSRMP